MAKKQTVGTSSGKSTRRATAPPLPEEVDETDKRVRGKPVSLHPLSFAEALRVMIKTPPPPRASPKKK